MSTTVPAARSTASTQAPALSDRPGRRTTRDPFFDNAKLLLVTLVVVGHSWVLMPDAPTAFPAYSFLYAWHVPAFVIVTGYLSRGFSYSREGFFKLLTTVVVPYLVFEALLALFRVNLGGESMGSPLFLDPHWPMWYLAALLLWRLWTPLLRASRHPMAVAVVVSLLGGLLTTDWLDLSRAAGLLPFFVLGMTMSREQFDRLAAPGVRAWAAAALVLAFVVAVLVARPLSMEWLYWRSGYAEMGVPPLLGMAARLVMLLVAGGLALSALALVPRSQRWFTPLGSASLVVYLCHGFAVKLAQYAGVGDLVDRDPVTAFLLITLGAVGVSLLLSATPVARRLNVLVDPITTVTANSPGALEPDHHRTQVQHDYALVHRRPGFR